MQNLTSDIYYFNNSRLLEKDYFDADFEEQKRLIDEVLKEYLIKVIKMIKLSNRNLESYSVMELMAYLREILSPDDRDKVFSSIIFYIIGLINNFQSYSVDWRLETYEELTENPHVLVCGKKAYSVVTSKDTDELLTFELVYRFLHNKLDDSYFHDSGDYREQKRLYLKDMKEENKKEENKKEV